MSQPEALYRLQEIDLDIMRSQERLKQIGDLLANDEAVRTARAQVDSAQATLNPLKLQLRTLEHDIQSNESKTRTTEQQLYSGAVKNPKEMQDMQQEIEALKRWHGELEDTMLETMLAAEDAEAALGGAQSNLESVVASQGEQHHHLQDEQTELQAHIEQCRVRREQVLTEITPENLKIYNTMKAKKNHQPIAAMRGNTCSFCGVAQTVSIEREVRQGIKLVNCSNCERILVAM